MRRPIPALVGLLALAAPAAAEVIDIDNPRLEQLIAQGVPVVDVRTPPEWQQTGVVAGSHLLMFFDAGGRYDADAWLDALGSIAGPEDPVILICRTGNRTSSIASFLNQRVGYSTVYNVRRGISDWIAQGKPTAAPKASADKAGTPIPRF